MPSILNLKFKGNKSFVAFSNLSDTESLTKTWKVCTKVASYLEQGQRLENLSWRLWHLQNLMVDTDNAKSKREFKKLSKCMGDKLDKEKGRSIEELEAPDFKRNHSTDLIRQRAAEKEKMREASSGQPGTIKRMQFTFSVDQPSPVTAAPVKKPDTKPSAEFAKRSRTTAVQRAADEIAMSTFSAPPPMSSSSSLHFPALFSNDFGPSALLYAQPTLTTPMNYGEGLNPSTTSDSFSISRPTIELPLDEILFSDESNGSPAMGTWSLGFDSRSDEGEKSEGVSSTDGDISADHQDVVMQSVPAAASTPTPISPVMKPTMTTSITPINVSIVEEDSASYMIEDEDRSPAPSATRRSIFKNIPPLSQAAKESLPETVAPSRVNSIYGTRSSTPTNRPTLTLRTQSVNTRSSGPGATATSLNPAILRTGSGNSAPGGVKAECSNCGATHTPLWRRGLNDELNCNACGLYCKLHKRPRPKSMRNSHGEGRAQAAPRQETVDVTGELLPPAARATRSETHWPQVAAQCYNCHTTATPLWRKDDEGKTVCNACGLYYKLHGSARPISMKSDVIRKRSRHDARRSIGGTEDTASTSPGINSRRGSPARDASPTLAPDSTTQITYDFGSDEPTFTNSTSSELMGALGTTNPIDPQVNLFGFNYYPGPYHPDYLAQILSMPSEGYSVENNTGSMSAAPADDPSMSPRSPKRRRMSTDSEPASSTNSFASFDAFSSASSSSSSHQKRASMDSFPFSVYNANGSLNQGPVLRGSGNTFWHPPMMPQSSNDGEGNIFHPTMRHGHTSNLSTSSTVSSASSTSSTNSSRDGSTGPPSSVTSEDSPMDYLHPPMVLPEHEEEMFSAYLHPPMDAGSPAKNGPVDCSTPGNTGGQGHANAVYVDGYY